MEDGQRQSKAERDQRVLLTPDFQLVEDDDHEREPMSTRLTRKLTYSVDEMEKLAGTVLEGAGKKEWEFRSPEHAAAKFFEDLKESVEEKTADIYVVTSILRCPRYYQFDEAEHCSPISSYRVWKCLLCAFLQLIVTPLVAVDQAYNTYVDFNHQICHHNINFSNIVGKIVACSFAYYIHVLFLKSQFNNNSNNNPGNYLTLQMNRVPTMVHVPTFVWGKFINNISRWVTSLSAIILIWSSSDPMSIIMNSLAIFFINELDDGLVNNTEYNRAKRILARLGKNSYRFRRVGCLFWPMKMTMAFFPLVCLVTLTASPYFLLACYGTNY